MNTFFLRYATAVGATTLALANIDCHGGSSSGAPSTDGTGAATAASASAAASAGPPAFPVSQADVDSVLNPGHLPEYTGPTGSIEGTVTIDGPSSPDAVVDTSKCPAALDTYGKVFREGKPAAPLGPRPLADAVVVVTGYEGFYLKEKSDVVQVAIGTNCAFPTRTIAITYGQRLDVANKTGMLFAPIIDQEPGRAIMVAPPHESGDPVRLYSTKAGRFTISDRMEPFIHEDLFVFRHPLHAVTDSAGHFRIDGVPAGKLKVGVSHPAARVGVEVPVEVQAGAAQKVDVATTYKPLKVSAGDAGASRLRVH